MKNKKHNLLRRCILPLLVTVCTAVNLPASAFAYMDETAFPLTGQESLEYPIGDVDEIELISLTEEEAAEVCRVAELNSEAVLAGQIPIRYEGSYRASGSYYYNNMSSAEKTLYNKIVNSCEGIFNSSANITYNDGGNYYTSYISLDAKLTKEAVRKIVYVVYYSNPQYFFINARISCFTDPASGLVTSVAVGIREEYINGSVRMSINSQIQAIKNEWMSQINKLGSDLEKEKWIAQKLCETITYNKDSANNQTIVGALVDRECVCNGYTMAMTYLCNAAGIDCIAALGNNHAWNIVRINGVWYETDVTWMDHTTDSTYIKTLWFNKSRATFLSNDDYREGHHIDTTIHSGIMSIPGCTSDYPLCIAHVWEKGVVTRQPTDTSYGLKFHWCSVCSAGETAWVCPLRYHQYSADKYEFDGRNHWQICTECQTEGAKEAHNILDGACTVCGYKAVKGDVTGDGKFTLGDIIKLSFEYRRKNADKYVPSADMNGDGKITLFDIIKLCSILRGKTQ